MKNGPYTSTMILIPLGIRVLTNVINFAFLCK